MEKEEVWNQISSIIKTELSILIKRIAIDFKTNYKRKVNNWTLADFDSVLVAHMVFVSSFESKSGNMFQKIAKEIAKLKYGEENIPLVIQGLGVSNEEFNKVQEEYQGKEQIILTKINQSDCQSFIIGFRERNKASGLGKTRVNSTLNQKMLREINKQRFEVNKTITHKPVDLAIYNPKDKMYYIIEIKAGGDLDSSNAPGNVMKMLTEYAILGKDNVNLYFATLYNKNGEGKTWTGLVKKYFSSELLLIGKEFWNLVLPSEISFDELGEIYNEVTKELGINDKINDLIREVKQ